MEFDAKINEIYNKLEKNIVDIMAEEQAKLGYRREKVRLYYPLSSLRHFFDDNEADSEAIYNRLNEFPQYMNKQYGDINVTYSGDRFCFVMSPEASEYVHNNNEKNTFIQELVGIVGRHGATMQEIIDLFNRQQAKCVAEEMNNGEFDLMIRFENSDDRYYYCFKDEGCHIIYHRFLPEDYKDLMS